MQAGFLLQNSLGQWTSAYITQTNHQNLHGAKITQLRQSVFCAPFLCKLHPQIILMQESSELTKRERGIVLMRSIMDYGMGTLWLSMGIFLAFNNHFDTIYRERLDDPAFRIFGGVCVLYGLFRIYRGYKKNYLRER